MRHRGRAGKKKPGARPGGRSLIPAVVPRSGKPPAESETRRGHTTTAVPALQHPVILTGRQKRPKKVGLCLRAPLSLALELFHMPNRTGHLIGSPA